MDIDGDGLRVITSYSIHYTKLYEYLRAYETPAELQAGLSRYFEYYNTKRRHSALDRRTPDAVYFAQAVPAQAA